MLPDDTQQQAVVIGRDEVVIPFRAVGLDVVALEPGDNPVTRVEQLISQGYQLIFFTADLGEVLQPLVERFRSQAVPCLVALPFTDTGRGEEGLRDAVRRACGVDLLGEKSMGGA